MQSKLAVSRPGDAYEQEAERVADQLMRTRGAVVQPQVETEAGEEAEEGPILQARSISSERGSPAEKEQGEATAPATVHEVLNSPGHSLDDDVRSFIESQLGNHFRRVRVHTDLRAAESARALHAAAYTVGSDIVFGSGQYAPQSPTGLRLLAHELTHVVQQSGSAPDSGALELGQMRDRFEREAYRASEEVTSSQFARDLAAGNPGHTPAPPAQAIMRSPLAQFVPPVVAAALCLARLKEQMNDETSRFLDRYCKQAGPMIPNNHWDAFGHCWIACEGTRQCGRAATWAAGTMYEALREMGVGGHHDSFLQDMANQAGGRELAKIKRPCSELCQLAVVHKLLDLSAPTDHCWDCETKRFTRESCPGARKTSQSYWYK